MKTNVKIELNDGTILNFENVKSIEKNEVNWKIGTKFDLGSFLNARNQECYFVNMHGNVGCTRLMCSAIDLDKFGNFSIDKKYMENRAKKIRLYNLLSNFAEVMNDGWRPSNVPYPYESKYSCKYDSIENEWKVNCERFNMTSEFEVYFKSRTLAQRAIDEIIKPFMEEVINEKENINMYMYDDDDFYNGLF